MSQWIGIAPLLTVGLGSLALMVVDAFTRERAELAMLSAVIFLSRLRLFAVRHHPSS